MTEPNMTEPNMTEPNMTHSYCQKSSIVHPTAACYDRTMKRFEKALNAYRRASKQPAEVTRPETPHEKRIQQLLRETGEGGGGKRGGKRGGERGGERGGKLGAERAAKFLMLLGKTEAAEILKHLSEEEVAAITARITEIDRIENNEAGEILNDFQVKRKRGITGRSGTGVAKKMLVKAFGKEKADQIYRKAVPLEYDNPFAFLDDLEFQQILMLLKKEPAPVIGALMPYLNPKKASMVLEALHPSLQMKVVARVAKMERVSPEALIKVAEALRDKIRRQGRLVTTEIDGPRVLADILSSMPMASEREILENIDLYHPDICEEIKELLFTVEVVFQLSDQDLQSVLREFSDEELAVVVKGKDERVRRRILDSVSERRRMIIEEEGARLGPMKRTDVDKATTEFVHYIRELGDDGKILIRREHDILEDK